MSREQKVTVYLTNMLISGGAGCYLYVWAHLDGLIPMAIMLANMWFLINIDEPKFTEKEMLKLFYYKSIWKYHQGIEEYLKWRLSMIIQDIACLNN